ncbi:MAG: putative abductin-like protein [Myxococcaceae bacterium]|nr:putative abductin-like protein [Myxococcaceae bacterium]
MTMRALLCLVPLLVSACHSEPPPAAPAASSEAQPPGAFGSMDSDAGLTDAMAMHFPTPAPTATTAAAPTASATATEAPAGPITVTPNATRVDRAIAALRSRLRSCYSAALKNDPGMSGKTIFKVVVGADGHVTSAEPADPTALPKPLVDCLRKGFLAIDVGADPGVSQPTTLTLPINVDAQ